ncbi:MAG: bifunctional nicotinamidase/pyrazinamidase [Rhodothermales bacterium]
MRALLVVDVQYDFLPGGSLAVPEADEIIPAVNDLIHHFDHVVFTQDWHPAGHDSFASSHEGHDPFDVIEVDYGDQILWPDHCVQGTRGAELHDDLDVDRAELIIRKGFRRDIDSYSAFFENDGTTPTGLTGYLRERGIDTLYVVGLALDFCVHWSAVDGSEQGFDVMVVEDGSRPIDTEGSLDEAMGNMESSGVKLVTAEEARAVAAV